jgi:hemerythrin HHE cation binding domain-containing protein
MDAARLMITDHDELTDLLSRLERDPYGPVAKQAMEHTIRWLRAHLAAVDELLIPAVRARASDSELAGIDAAEATDIRIGFLLDQLLKLRPEDPELASGVHLLQETFARHVDKEAVIVARAEELLSDDELIDLGNRMERREAELLAALSLSARATRALRTVALIVMAGVALSVIGRLRQPLTTSGPRPAPPD